MFDIGFMELLLIGIVALLVLGPDKLPGAIRTGALWFGRAKRSFNNVKAEIEQQINTDEIRRQLHNESILGDIEKAKKNANKLIKDTQAEIKSAEDSVKQSVDPASKSSAAPRATTTSADEGIPTPPPENYNVPDNTRSAAAGEPETGPGETSDETNTESAATSVETTSQTDATEQAEPEPENSQDIYSTPPSGIVSMQKGKFSAVNDKPADSGSSSDKK